MPRAIGIDLGTTNTAVAVLEGGRPRVLEDERGYKVLPSVVSAKGEGRFIVGQAAHSLIITNPDATVYAVKRLLGRRFDSPEVQKVLSHVQYKLRPGPDGGVQLQIGDQWMTPSEVSAVILQVARGIAERALGEPVEEAVITVPAYFNHAQRAATMEAAEIAGLKCDRLLNEPTAAALAYGHRKNIERTIVIFDLGGGTFDVSVLKLSDGLYEILASTGDTFLGGEDFDYRIVDHLADHFKARARVDPRQDRSALQRLKDAAERAKCELSFSDRTNIVIPHLASGESLEMVLTRSTLESLTTDLVDRCLGIARRAVSDAGLSLADIEEVILVGGQTRMPKVREAVTGVFGREPSRSVHPEEVVAIGAAVHAANLEAGEAARTVLLDVTPFDLGIDTAGGMFVPVISRNARVPASEGKVFATIADNQETVRITVRQGDNRTAVQNEFLGEFVLEGLTPAPRLQTKVDVTFRIDTNGMLHVAALERGKDERRNITIRNYAEHARSPAFPDADQARADELARKMRADQGAAAPKKSKSNGRGSLIDLLLRRNRKPASPAAANPATTGPASGEEAPSGTAGAEATGVDVAPLQTSSIDAPSIDAVAMAAAAMAAGAATGTPRSGSAAVFGTSSTARSRGGPPSTTSDIGGTLPEAEAATLLEEWNEADLTPADGIVLDPYVEPLPVAFDEDEAVVLDGGSGLSPFDEDVYEDAGAGASLGLAGGLSGAQAAENPFADLGNPASPPARDTSRSLSLSDLFLDEDGLGDVEVIDPFSARGRAMDETFAGIDVALDGESPATPRAGALPAAPPARGAPRGGSGFPGVGDPPPRVAPPGLPDDFDVLFGSPFSRPATADPLADPFGRPGAPEAPIPPPSFLQAPATSWEEDQRGLASDVTVFAAPDDQDDEPEGARQDAPALAEFDLLEATAGLDEIAGLDDIGVLEDVGPLDDLAVAGLPEEAGPADPDLLAGPQLLDPDLATVWEAHRPQGLPSWPRGRSTPEPVESTPTRTEAPATGFALLDPDTDVRAALAAAGVAATPAARKRAGTLDWMDAAVAADTEWSVTDVRSDVRSEAHTMPGADPAPSRPPTTRPRKPARVRLHYRELETFVNDARESLRRGGTFVRTERPLKVGRECVFEIAAPGLSEPLVLRALVTFVATAGPGQEAGMGVEYQLDETTRRKVEQLLNRL